jgi:hypothetical protein
MTQAASLWHPQVSLDGGTSTRPTSARVPWCNAHKRACERRWRVCEPGAKRNFWWTKGRTLKDSGMTVGIRTLIFGFLRPLKRRGIA